MSVEILIVSAVILAYFGIGFVFRKRAMSPFLGLEFLLVGFLFSLVSIEKINFIPVLPPILGTFGLLAGLQFKNSQLKQLEKGFLKTVSVYIVSVFLLLFFSASLFLDRLNALFFSIVFLYPSYKVLATFVPDRGVENRKKLFLSAFIPFVGAFMYFAFSFLFFSQANILVYILLIIAFSFIAKFLLDWVEDNKVFTVLIIGITLMFSEIFYIMEFSPYVSMFFLGYLLANFSEKSDDVFNIVLSDEKQLYTVFLISFAFLLGFDFSFYILKLTLFILLINLFVKFLFWKSYKRENFLLYLSPGAFGVVLIADFWLLSGQKHKSPVVLALIFAIILTQLITMISLKRVFKND